MKSGHAKNRFTKSDNMAMTALKVAMRIEKANQDYS